jgi:hypothetical protein
LHQSHVSRSTGDAPNSRREPLAFLGVQENLRCPVDLRPLQWNEEERALVSSDGARRYPVDPTFGRRARRAAALITS